MDELKKRQFDNKLDLNTHFDLHFESLTFWLNVLVGHKCYFAPAEMTINIHIEYIEISFAEISDHFFNTNILKGSM